MRTRHNRKTRSKKTRRNNRRKSFSKKGWSEEIKKYGLKNNKTKVFNTRFLSGG
jgi:hypothetical protein